MRSDRSAIEKVLASELQESIEVKRCLVGAHMADLGASADLLVTCLHHGGTVLLFGNGGSAADAQHVSAELVSRFRRDRRALPAVALTTDTSILTSIGNDFGFAHVFERQIEALGKPGDLAWGFSTSGASENVLRAMDLAREKGMATLGFTGSRGRELRNRSDVCLSVPSASTARVQEAHLCVAHALCEIAERKLGLPRKQRHHHEPISRVLRPGRHDQRRSPLPVSGP